MARLSFITLEGDRKAYKLDKLSMLRIGRDPGNDVVLRDARVSRLHAKVAFERGFYVIHDLDSGNGTFVNGQRVRVAPLTEGAQIRLGSSIGFFSEEIGVDDEVDNATINAAISPLSEHGSADTDDPITSVEPAYVDSADRSDPAPSFQTYANGSKLTLMGDVELPEDVFPGAGLSSGAREGDEGDEEEEDDSEDGDPTRDVPIIPDLVDATGGATVSPGDSGLAAKFALGLYVVDTGPEAGGRATIRDEAERPLFYFRSPITPFVGCVAGFVSGVVIVTGLAVGVIMLVEGRLVYAIAAAAMAVLFSWMILLLAPRQHFVLFEDEGLEKVVLRVIQRSRFSFPSLRYAVETADENTISILQRSAWDRIGRHRWKVLDRYGTGRIGFAIEDSLSRAVMRNVAGTFFGLLRTGFRIEVDGRQIGAIRRTPLRSRTLLDLSGDGRFSLDRRTGVALAMVIHALEMR